MKNTNFIILSILLVITFGCKKEEVVSSQSTVITRDASDINLYSATLNGEVSNEGASAVTERGFVYSKSSTNPTVSDSKTLSGYGTGPYKAQINGLDKNTQYYFKAFAKNANAISYGDTKLFSTSDFKTPTVLTKTASLSFNTVVNLIGEVTDLGGTSGLTEYGFVLGLKTSPTTSNGTKIIIFSSVGGASSPPFAPIPFSSSINLASNKKYYIRSYAINVKGESYGTELSLSTSNKVETIVSTIKSSVTGRIWMDRNLGASQAATALSDNLALGDLYQWGRNADGHEITVSETTTSLSNSDNTSNGLFIIAPKNKDWKINSNNNLWQSNSGLNNVCPTGFRLPTITEFLAEKEGIVKNNSGNYSLGELKLPYSRVRTNDGLVYSNSTVSYWTSSVYDGDSNFSFVISNNLVNIIQPKSYGMPVRCIKN